MKQYQLIDSGNKRRLEKYGEYLIDRPDPEVMWGKSLPDSEWAKADAIFNDGWQKKKDFPESWQIEYDGIKINLKLTPFKHVGIFPEQEFEWEQIANSVQRTVNSANILSLFGYTGVASLVALKSGARVTHVDASRPAISWFRENQTTSGLLEKPARIIVDDCLKFAEREVKRGVKYDGIIMDPPVYGHGPKGEPWNFSKDFPKLLDTAVNLLSNDPLFIIINAYAVSTSPTTLENMLRDKIKGKGGDFVSGELYLNEESSGRKLTTGIYAIYKK